MPHVSYRCWWLLTNEWWLQEPPGSLFPPNHKDAWYSSNLLLSHLPMKMGRLDIAESEGRLPWVPVLVKYWPSNCSLLWNLISTSTWNKPAVTYTHFVDSWWRQISLWPNVACMRGALMWSRLDDHSVQWVTISMKNIGCSMETMWPPFYNPIPFGFSKEVFNTTYHFYSKSRARICEKVLINPYS